MIRSIFISSTFRDLNEERDFIRDKIGARLYEYTTENYGIGYDFMDLRIGVENAKNKGQTIDACLSVLKESAPPNPFIVIIGDSWGRAPDTEALNCAIEELDDEDSDIKGYLENVRDNKLIRSYTSLEIDYGAFGLGAPEEDREKYKKRTLFIFKTRATQDNDENIAKLKERIEADFPGQIIYMDKYGKSPLKSKRFENAVFNKLKTIIKKANKTKLDKDRIERMLHEEYMELKARGFYGREEIIKDIKKSIDKEEGYTYIYGPSGIGKSSLVSKIAKDYKEENIFDVFPIYCGLTTESDASINIIDAITSYLRKGLTEYEKDDTRSSLDEYKYVCQKYDDSKDTKTVLIIIDAIDQLSPDDYKNNLAFLPFKLHKKIRILLSGVEADENEIKKNYPKLNKQREYQKFHFLEIGGISAEETEGILKNIFGKEYNKGAVLNSVVNELRDYDISSPLLLKLVSLRIATFSQEEEVSLQNTGGNYAGAYLNLVKEFLCSEAEEIYKQEFLNKVIAVAEKGQDTLKTEVYAQYGQAVEDFLDEVCDMPAYTQLEALILKLLKSVCDNEQIYSAMQYIAVSRHGLSETMLKSILGEDFNVGEFSVLRYKLRHVFFKHGDGCVDFIHKNFRHTLLKEIRNENFGFEKFKDMFSKKNDKDSAFESFCNTLSKEIKDEKNYYVNIFNAIETELKKEKQTQKETHNSKFITTEFGYYAIKAENDSAIVRYIKENSSKKNDVRRAEKEERLNFLAKEFLKADNNVEVFVYRSKLPKSKRFVDFCFGYLEKNSSLLLRDTLRCDKIYESVCDKIYECFPYYSMYRINTLQSLDVYLRKFLYCMKAFKKYIDFKEMHNAQVDLRTSLLRNPIKMWEELYDSDNHVLGILKYCYSIYYEDILFNHTNIGYDLNNMSYECVYNFFLLNSRYYPSLIYEKVKYPGICFETRISDWEKVALEKFKDAINSNRFYFNEYDMDDNSSTKKNQISRIVTMSLQIMYLQCVIQKNELLSFGEIMELNKQKSDNESCKEAIERLKLAIKEEKASNNIDGYSPEEELISVYNSSRNTERINKTNVEDLEKEFNEALTFLRDYIDENDYHKTAIGAIKKYLAYMEENKERGRLKDEYIRNWHLEIASFFAEHYNKEGSEKAYMIDVYYFIKAMPACIENDTASKSKWLKSYCSFRKVMPKEYDFSRPHLHGEFMLDLANKFAENADELFGTAYSDALEELVKTFSLKMEEFFSYYEQYSLFTEKHAQKILNSLRGDTTATKKVSLKAMLNSIEHNRGDEIEQALLSLIDYRIWREKEGQSNSYVKWAWKKPVFNN